MTIRIEQIEPDPDRYTVRIAFSDGWTGSVDFSSMIARGGVFAVLAERDRFREVRIADYGHHLYWLDAEGDEIDFGADRLRSLAQPVREEPSSATARKTAG